jgi:hypothetical protein
VPLFTFLGSHFTKLLPMRKVVFTCLILSVAIMGCKLEAAKKQNGAFKANGTQYQADEDHVTAGYNSSNLLNVTLFTGQSQTFGVSIEVDLTKINTTTAIDIGNEAFYYSGANSAVFYKPISGTWIITSHKEGNPATRHTEGNFEFTAVNPYTPYDTVHITEGHFYVNNY